MKLAKSINETQSPPIMAVARWMEGLEFSKDRPLLNLSQAAPTDPPPEALREELARLIKTDPTVHLYGPDLGLPELRSQVASDWETDYRGQISPDQVAITSGCNQAFCGAISAIAESGDNIIVPSPFYFNHHMHLTSRGIETRAVQCAIDMRPDVTAADALISDRTRAIVLVTPNNPTGAEYPSALIYAFYTLAKRHGIALILDETYRDFRTSDERAHTLFEDPSWPETLIHLYSFSKAYRITGHRVGAMIASQEILAAVEKYIDCDTICPNQLGQRAALFGLQHLKDWKKAEAQKILERREIVLRLFGGTMDGRVLSCGAYFAYLDHQQDEKSDDLARRFLSEQSVLVLPGTMFTDAKDEGELGARTLRIAFANTDQDGLAELARRWRRFVS